jgi:hypothetical protein
LLVNETQALSPPSVNGCCGLVDLSGFTQMKRQLPSNVWYSSLVAFFSKCEHVLDDAGVTNRKWLGDGILFHSLDCAPDQWVEMIDGALAPAVRSFCEDHAPIFPFEYSLVAGYGEYFLLREDDPVGVTIDELFLVERHGLMNRTLICVGLYERLGLIQKRTCEARATEEIEYLGGMRVKHFEIKGKPRGN